MNAVEQRTHRTITRDLQTQFHDLVDVVAAIDQQLPKLWGDTIEALKAERQARHTMRDELRAAIGEERTHRLTLADEQRRYVDGQDRELRRLWNVFWRDLTVWQRLRWLVTGKS